ncbi:nitroreductase family protein [Vibrio splendidus]
MEGIKSLYKETFGEFKFGSVTPIAFESVSTKIQQTNNNTLLVESINQRRSSRKASTKPVSITELSYILETSLGVTEKIGDDFFYTTPCAGGERELRYIIIPNNVEGFSSRSMLEYVPEVSELISVSMLRSEIFYSDWESFANFNVVFCLPKKNVRKYKNNEFLACFEAGCCSQNLQLVSGSINYTSCVSGIINVPEFNAHIDNLIPLQAISLSKE